MIGHCKIYKQAHTVFNCAITDDENKDFAKLYIANQNLLSQGSSIYKSKKNSLMMYYTQILKTCLIIKSYNF